MQSYQETCISRWCHTFSSTYYVYIYSILAVVYHDCITCMLFIYLSTELTKITIEILMFQSWIKSTYCWVVKDIYIYIYKHPNILSLQTNKRFNRIHFKKGILEYIIVNTLRPNLRPNRRHAIIWNNDGPVNGCICTSLGLNELIE